MKEKDKEWEERGNSAYVYDMTYVRHWDVWQGIKGQQLFSTHLSQDNRGVWKLNDDDFNSPLRGTKHVCIPLVLLDLICLHDLTVYPGGTFWGN